MSVPWDVHLAEYADTVRSQHSAREKRPCRYCGTLTRALSQVCCAHSDLIVLDPQGPKDWTVAESGDAVLAETVEAVPQPLPASASAASSGSTRDTGGTDDRGQAAVRTDGIGSGRPRVAALDFPEAR